MSVETESSPEPGSSPEEIVERYRKFLRDAISSVCPRDMGLQFDDIEQEACLRLLRAVTSEREIRDLASYAYRIAATTTIDAIRRVKARREEQLRLDNDDDQGDAPVHIVPDAPEQSPERQAERRELAAKIQSALSRLSGNRRQAVALHLEGMTTQEVADLLGWTEPKARNLVYRGLSDLRELLRAEGIDG